MVLHCKLAAGVSINDQLLLIWMRKEITSPKINKCSNKTIKNQPVLSIKPFNHPLSIYTDHQKNHDSLFTCHRTVHLSAHLGPVSTSPPFPHTDIHTSIPAFHTHRNGRIESTYLPSVKLSDFSFHDDHL